MPQLRLAEFQDVPAMHRIRLAVTENRLTDSSKVTEEAYLPFVATRSLWLAEVGGEIAGFAALDRRERSVWALFVAPAREGQGVGRLLHDHLIAEVAKDGVDRLELTTEPGSRAERFYLKAGWKMIGSEPGGEVRLAISPFRSDT